MPTVPRYESRVTPGVSQARQNINATPEAFGAGVARSMSNLAQGAADIAARAEQIAIENDETAAREAYIAASDALRDRMRGEEGFLTTQGPAAGEAYEGFIRDVDGLRDQYGANLNRRAREQFDSLWATRSESALNSGATHVFNQRQVYQEQVRSAEIQERETAAIESSGSAAMVGVEINAGAEVIRRQAQEMGMDGDVVDQQVDAWRSQTLLTTISAALDAGDNAAAERLYTAHEGLLVGGQREQARGLIDGATTRERSQAGAAEVFARFGTDERAARAHIRENFEGEMEDNLITRYDRLAAEASETAAISDAELFSQVEAHIEAGGTVDSLPPTMYDALDSDMRDYYRRAESGEPRYTNFDFYDQLLDMTPRQLRDVDPRTLRAGLADREYNEIMGRRDREFTPSDFTSVRSLNALISSAADANGINSDEDRGEFYAIIQQRITDEESSLGRTMSPTEREAVVARYAAEVRFTRPGRFGRRNDDRQAGQIESREIPGVAAGHMAAVEAAFSGANAVSEDAASQSYIAALAYLNNNGLPVNLYTLERAVRREYERELISREEALRANRSEQSQSQP